MQELVHTWIPLAIVIASVLAAVVGWRASVAEEHATHHEELSRQDLVQQQAQLVQDRNAVATDLQTFGQFAEFSSIGHALLTDAGRISGPTGDELRTQGESDLGVARSLGKQIRWLNYAYDPSSPGTNPNLRTDGSISPATRTTRRSRSTPPRTRTRRCTASHRCHCTSRRCRCARRRFI